MEDVLGALWGLIFLVLLAVGITLVCVSNPAGWTTLGCWLIWFISGAIVAGACR